jgi:acyl-CoA thioesterase FadM
MPENKLVRHSFKIRVHDLDFKGKASTAALIRLLENQRWHALSSQADIGAYFLSAVMRAQSIALDAELRFDDEVEGVTWVSAVGRSSLTFGHTLASPAAGGVFARAAVSVVSLDLEGRSRPLGEGIRRLIVERESIDLPRLEPLPVPGDAWSNDFRVRYSDLDLLQHVNEARYVNYVEDTRHACAAQGGYGPDSQRASGRLRRLSVSYEGQARAGDRLRVSTWQLPDAAGSYAFEVRREPDGALMTLARLEVAD